MKKPCHFVGVGLITLLSVWGYASAQARGARDRYRPYRAYGSSGPFNSQLYVTGQVTGLRSFHGNIGYQAPDQLQVIVPSGSLDRFRRQSVGMQESLRGRTYLPSPYYRRTRTAFGVNKITSGLTAPGTNVPAQSVVSIQARRRYSKFEVDARARGTEPVDRESVTRSPVRRYRRFAVDERLSRRDATRSGSFGLIRWRDRLDLAQEIRQVSSPQPQEADWSGDPNRSVNAAIDVFVDVAVDASIDAEASLRPPFDGKSPLTPEAPGQRGRANLPAGRRRTDQDVMTDILYHVRLGGDEERIFDANAPAGLLIPAPPKSEPPPVPQQSDSRRLVERLGRNIMIYSLAGDSKNMFNVRMAIAEKLLKTGRYYAAARKYETAMLIDPDNPLVHVGLGMAFFAAGEPLSAGGRIYRAMQLFPELKTTRLNIEELIPTRTINRRLLVLNDRIEDDSDPILVFLAAYIRMNLGRDDTARRYATMLGESAGENEILRDYAQYVLTNTTTTKPASPL